MLTGCAFSRPYLNAQGNCAANGVGAGYGIRQSCQCGGSHRRRGSLRRLKTLLGPAWGRPRAQLSHYAARPGDRGSPTLTALPPVRPQGPGVSVRQGASAGPGSAAGA